MEDLALIGGFGVMRAGGLGVFSLKLTRSWKTGGRLSASAS